jgi:hypothetical protein
MNKPKTVPKEPKEKKTKTAVIKHVQPYDLRWDVMHAKQLVDNNEIQKAKDYVKQFFFHYQGQVFFFSGNSYTLYDRYKAMELIPDDIVRDIVIPNMDKYKFESTEFKLKTFLKTSEFMKDQFEPTIDFTQAQSIFSRKTTVQGVEVERKYINMGKQLPEDMKTPYESNDVRNNAIKLLEDHIKTVWANEDEAMYEYVMNFFACTVAGRKLRKCLYLQSHERSGKGIPLNFLKKILGDRMCKTSSVETIVKYTKPFEGCLLLNFDELPMDSDTSWKCLSDKLKPLITEPYFDCRDMHHTPYEQVNTFNIIISTNNDAILLTQTNKERYVILDINEKYIGNIAYFEELIKALDMEGVKQLFYQKLLKRFADLKNWNEEVVPETKSKAIKVMEALPIIFKFVKENYILKKVNKEMETKDFFAMYYKQTGDKSTKQKLGRNLKMIGIEPIKRSDNKYVYKYHYDSLLEIYTAKNWIDELTDHIVEERADDDENDYDIPLDKQIESLKNEIYGKQQLLLQLEEKLKQQNHDNTYKQELENVVKEWREHQQQQKEQKEEKPKTALKKKVIKGNQP